jgi:hypothetical protein
MFHYHLNGLRIESDRPLPAARRAGGGADVPAGSVLALRTDPAGAPPGEAFAALASEGPSVLFVRAHDDGEPWLSVGRRAGGYLVVLHGYASFWIDHAGREIVCRPEVGAAPEAVEQLLLDQVVPMVLQLRGQPSFHASAVIVERPGAGRGVVAFVGASGMGKSTLAASLASPADRAGEASCAAFAGLFSDDCLAVRPTSAGVLVQPSYPSLRLLPDAATALFRDRPDLPLVSPRTRKRRVELGAETEALPLLRVYLLEQADAAPAVARLRRVEAFAALARHLHRLDPERRDCLAGEMAVLERVASEVIVARLSYRRSFGDLPAVRAAILADLSA